MPKATNLSVASATSRILAASKPVRLGLALLLLEQDEGGVPVDDDDPVRLGDGILVDPDIEIIPSAVPGLQGQVAAGEGDAGIAADRARTPARSRVQKRFISER